MASGDLTHIYSGNPFWINETNSTSTIIENNGAASYVNISINGHLYYVSSPSSIRIELNISIEGHLKPNLYPTGLVLSINASGPNLGNLSGDESAPNTVAKRNMIRNTSSDSWLYFPYIKNGTNYTSISKTIRLLNSPHWSLFKNTDQGYYYFSYYSLMAINMYHYHGIYKFGFSAGVTGLKEIPRASVNLQVEPA